MNKLTILLVIAKNGLDTAQLALDLKASALNGEANAESDPVKKKTLLATSKKLTKLSRVLRSAEVGITDYLGFDETVENTGAVNA